MLEHSNGCFFPNYIISGGVGEIVTGPSDLSEQRLWALAILKRYVCCLNKPRLLHEIHMVRNTFIIVIVNFWIFIDFAMRIVDCFFKNSPNEAHITVHMSPNVGLWTPPIVQDECAVGLMDKPAKIYPAYYGARRRRP